MIITRQENIKIIIITILIFLGSVVGLSYAYFSTQVEGNDEASSMTITTASLRLVYQDSQFIELNDAYPGNYVDKEVKVTNFSSIAVTFDMFFVDMVNTIINDELVISYTCTSYENYGEVTEAVVGICDGLEEQGITDNPAIEEAITIGPGLTNVYNIRIEFKEMGTNQSYNLNTNFRGKINIAESSDAFTLVLQVLDADGEPIEGALGEVHSKVRSGITNSSGIARISNVTQATHNLIIKESPNGEEILSTPITIEAVPVASTTLVNGTTITGQKGREEIAVRVQEVNNNITFVPLTDMVSLEINLNGGTIDQRFYSSYLLGEELELVEPEKVGYQFTGYEVTGTGASVNKNTLIIGTETAVTAMWTPTTYNITYNYDGGSGSNPANYNIESNSITLSVPQKTGYTFAGWTGSNGESPQMSVTISSGSTGDKSYTANWRYYLFNAGDVRMGGFTQSVNSTSMSWNISYNGSTISWSSSGQGWGVMKKIASNNAIDLTGFTKLVVHLTSYSGSSGGGDFGPYVGMCINNNVATSNHSATGIGGHIWTGTMSDYELTYTFSNVTSSYYFCTGFYVNHFGNYYSYSMSMVIDQVWLE